MPGYIFTQDLSRTVALWTTNSLRFIGPISPVIWFNWTEMQTHLILQQTSDAACLGLADTEHTYQIRRASAPLPEFQTAATPVVAARVLRIAASQALWRWRRQRGSAAPR